MTRALLVAVPMATIVAAVIGSVMPTTAAVILGGAVGVVVSAGLWGVQRRRVRDMASAINSWLGQRHHEPVAAPGGSAWKRLAIAVNALGAAFDRRGERLGHSRRLRKELVAAIDESALLFGADGYLVRANESAQRRFGVPAEGDYTPGQALGSSELAGAVAEARDVGQAITIEVTIGDRELNALATPVGEEILVLVSDRTERRLVDAVRRDFVANASHELKTPVSGIQALAEALTVTIGRDEERAAGLAERLDDEAQHLGNLVHDLLNLGRLEEVAGPDRRPIDLAEVLEEEIERVRPSAREKDLSLTADAPERAMIAASEEDIRLVVANLLDNAVGYNQAGGSVAVRLTRDDGAWRLRVNDTGIGIARQNLDRVFERFYRVDVARSRATGGTGLGLSLVRHAVERQGGTVAVDSILGEGSTFTVVLPVEPK